VVQKTSEIIYSFSVPRGQCLELKIKREKGEFEDLQKIEILWVKNWALRREKPPH